jgi:ATP synthase protein I
VDRRERISTIKTLGALSTVGFSFVFAILLGVAGGYWVDRWLGTSPWFFLFGFILGLIAGVLNVVRTSRKFLK